VLRKRIGAILAVISLLGGGCGADPDERLGQPNVLLIVVDDMGYSDPGVFGGEVPTPNIDRLAAEGVQLTQFHATPNCTTTRAALLSGVDHHRTGHGTMGELIAPNQRGKPGYEGHLNDRVVTMAELLGDAGYHTYMTGKWHLGFEDPASRPFARGFEQTFTLLAGGASHWQDNTPLIPGVTSPYARNGRVLDDLPKGFYSTNAYAEKMIEFLTADRSDGKPFFGYLAFTAPHNPLHAYEETIAKYRGRYDAGWDALRERRVQRLRERGLIPKDVPTGARPEWILAWEDLTEQQKRGRARDMEIYAAMNDLLDQAIGRVLDHLRESGQYDNTLIVFMSDNGASRTTTLDYAALGGETAAFFENFDNSLENRGLPGSSTDIGPGWAWAANAPFRLMKGYVTQGGMQVPAVVKLPGKMSAAGSSSSAFTHAVDIMPTVLEATGVDYPKSRAGRALHPLDGHSWRPMLRGAGAESFAEREMGFELYGLRAYRRGPWKALQLHEPYGSGAWQLYRLDADPAEAHDLATKHPRELADLVDAWNRWAAEYGVVEPDRAVGYAKPPRSGSH
jgi:arylsulfatase A-like enzyme